jgi:hypothetical protein
MRYLLITLTIAGSLFLAGCGAMGNIPKSVGLGKRPWLLPIPELTDAQKAQLGAAKNIIWTDLASPDKKPDGKVQLDELSIGTNPAVAQLQKNYLAYKAQFAVYMKEAWKINMAQLQALDWKKEDASMALKAELVRLGYSPPEIDAISQ